MSLKYWESMAERERNNISVKSEKIITDGSATSTESAVITDKSSQSTESASVSDRTNRSTESAVITDGSAKSTESAVSKNGSARSTESTANAQNTGAVENTSGEKAGQDTENTGKTNLPRPLAKFFGGILTGFSSIGISVLMALLIIVTVGCAVFALAFMAGGGFAVFEAFANIKSATLVALQYMGIGCAVFALGLLLMLATVKLIRYALPGTAGLFPKAVHSCMSL